MPNITKAMVIFLAVGVALAVFMAPVMMANEADARIECKIKGGQTVQGNCQGDDHQMITIT